MKTSFSYLLIAVLLVLTVNCGNNDTPKKRPGNLSRLFLEQHPPQAIGELSGHSKGVDRLMFIPNRKILISFSYGDRTIRSWNTANRWQLSRVKGYYDENSSVAMSGDGRNIYCSGAEDHIYRRTIDENGVIIGREVMVARKGGASAAVSPDGAFLVAAEQGEIARVFYLNTAQKKKPRKITKEKNHRFLKYSSNGRYVVGAGRGTTCTIWDTADWKEERLKLEKISNGRYFKAIDISADGNFLAAAHNAHRLIVIDLAAKREILNIGSGPSVPLCIAISPDNKLLASGHKNNEIYLWDTESGRKLAVLKGHEDDVTCLAFSSDGAILASGAGKYGRRIILWGYQDESTPPRTANDPGQRELPPGRRANVGDYQPVFQEYNGEPNLLGDANPDRLSPAWKSSSEVNVVFGREDNYYFVARHSGSLMQEVPIENISGKIVLVTAWVYAEVANTDPYDGNGLPEISVSFIPYDEDKSASGFKSHDMALTDMKEKTWTFIHGYEIVPLGTKSIKLYMRQRSGGPYKNKYAVYFDEPGIFIFDDEEEVNEFLESIEKNRSFDVEKTTPAPGEEKTTPVPGEEKNAPVLSEEKPKEILPGFSSSFVRHVNNPPVLIRELSGHEKGVNRLMFTQEDLLLSFSYHDNTMRSWETARGKQLSRIKAHVDLHKDLAVTADGRAIYHTDFDDNIVHRFIDENGVISEQKEIVVEKEWDTTAISPDGEFLVAGAQRKKTKVFFMLSDDPPRTISKEDNYRRLRFTPSGDLLVGVYDDGSVYTTWDTKTWKEQEHKIKNASSRVDIQNIDISADGRYLGIAHRGHRLIVIDLIDKREIHNFKYQESRPFCIAISPDNKLFASGHWDYEICLWDMKTGQKVAGLYEHNDMVTALAFNSDGTMLASGAARNDRRILLWGYKDKSTPPAGTAGPDQRVTPEGRREIEGEYRPVFEEFDGKPNLLGDPNTGRLTPAWEATKDINVVYDKEDNYYFTARHQAYLMQEVPIEDLGGRMLLVTAWVYTERANMDYEDGAGLPALDVIFVPRDTSELTDSFQSHLMAITGLSEKSWTFIYGYKKIPAGTGSIKFYMRKRYGDPEKDKHAVYFDEPGMFILDTKEEVEAFLKTF